MPQLRVLVASATAGVLVFGVLGFWLHWPTVMALTAAALLGVVFLMTLAALADDGAAADDAWRAAAADLTTASARAIGALDPTTEADETDAVAADDAIGLEP